MFRFLKASVTPSLVVDMRMNSDDLTFTVAVLVLVVTLPSQPLLYLQERHSGAGRSLGAFGTPAARSA